MEPKKSSVIMTAQEMTPLRQLRDLLRDPPFARFHIKQRCNFQGFNLDFYCPELRLALDLHDERGVRPENDNYYAERNELLRINCILLRRVWARELRESPIVLKKDLQRLFFQRSSLPNEDEQPEYPFPLAA